MDIYQLLLLLLSKTTARCTSGKGVPTSVHPVQACIAKQNSQRSQLSAGKNMELMRIPTCAAWKLLATPPHPCSASISTCITYGGLQGQALHTGLCFVFPWTTLLGCRFFEPSWHRLHPSGQQALRVKLSNAAGRVSEVCLTPEVTFFMYANISSNFKKHVFSPVEANFRQ